MMHPATTTVKVSGEAETLGAAAALLGFHPRNSVVLLCLSGPRRRIGPVIRMDLINGRIPEGAAHQLAEYGDRYADEAVVITFTDLGAAAAPDTTALVAAIRGVCPVLQVIDACNTPCDVPDQLRAAAVFNGRAVLPDRAALSRSVEHHPAAPPTRPDLADAMRTAQGRDRYLTATRTDPAAVPELVTAAQGAADTDPAAPNICAALALLAYRRGDGALAQVAIDRTLRLSPTHRLAHLILAVIAAALPPTGLDDVLRP